MAPTEGRRVAKPERRWGCRRGTPPQQIRASVMAESWLNAYKGQKRVQRGKKNWQLFSFFDDFVVHTKLEKQNSSSFPDIPGPLNSFSPDNFSHRFCTAATCQWQYTLKCIDRQKVYHSNTVTNRTTEGHNKYVFHKYQTNGRERQWKIYQSVQFAMINARLQNAWKPRIGLDCAVFYVPSMEATKSFLSKPYVNTKLSFVDEQIEYARFSNQSITYSNEAAKVTMHNCTFKSQLRAPRDININLTTVILLHIPNFWSTANFLQSQLFS